MTSVRPLRTHSPGYFSRFWVLVELIAVAMLASACGAATLAAAPGTRDIEVPPYATTYSTDAGRDGVRGSAAASQGERILRDKLAERGDSEARPDAALAATAAWAMKRA